LLRAGDLDFDGARADVERALQLDPADLLVQHRAANLYAAVGRLEDAVAAQWRATELDPLNGWRWMALTYYQLAAGRHAEARASADRALALEPDDFYVQYLGGLVDVLRGQPESALAAFAKMEGGQWSRQGRVLAEHLRGATESARATLTAMHAEYEANSANAFLIAEAHAWLGEHDAAFRWLDRAYVAREPGIAQYIRSSPLLAGLRDDARYAAYLRKVGMLR
jgi:serine/threonine-protein kinase